MRIAVVCNDTRGGVQPYAALAAGLAAAGHEVRAVAPASLTGLFQHAGVTVHPLSGDPEAEREATRVAERGNLAAARLMMREMPRLVRAATMETLAACDGVELMTGGIGGMVVGLAVADKLGVPFVKTHLQPVEAPARTYPGVMLSGMPAWLGDRGRLLSHYLSDRALWMMFRPAMAAARRDVLGLRSSPRAIEGQPTLYGFSRHVVPLPETGSRHVTGYWTLKDGDGWRPPATLTAFLRSGGPVVSIGFGSMAASEPGALQALVRQAAREARVRVVLLSGWSRMAAHPDDELVHCVGEAPHDWLFPRMAALVHHGGAGTTGAALASGVPSQVVPFAADQPFWGQRVAGLGAGPPPIPRRRLTARLLAAALRQMLDNTGMRDRAARLGRLIGEENGVTAAAAILSGIRLPRPGSRDGLDAVSSSPAEAP